MLEEEGKARNDSSEDYMGDEGADSAEATAKKARERESDVNFESERTTKVQQEDLSNPPLAVNDDDEETQGGFLELNPPNEKLSEQESDSDKEGKSTRAIRSTPRRASQKSRAERPPQTSPPHSRKSDEVTNTKRRMSPRGSVSHLYLIHSLSGKKTDREVRPTTGTWTKKLSTLLSLLGCAHLQALRISPSNQDLREHPERDQREK